MNKFLLLLFISFFALANASAQRVGVVLSGGGALGIAHIGVLKALEENNIPVDYIAGTSMGALVGGMYAAGWSPDEILKYMASDDFSYAAQGKIKPGYVYYFKRKDPDAGGFSFKMLKTKKRWCLKAETWLTECVLLHHSRFILSPYQ
jgi:NTE family protein